MAIPFLSDISGQGATFAGTLSIGGGDSSTAQVALKGQQSLLSFVRGTSGDAQFFMSSDSSRLYFSHTDIQSTNLILTLNQDKSANFASKVTAKSVSIQSDDDERFLVRSNDYTISRIISRGNTGTNLDKGLFSLMSSDGTNNNIEAVRIDSAGNSWFNGGAVSFAGAVNFTAQGIAGSGSINLENDDPFIRLHDNGSGSTTDKKKWDIRAIGATGYESFDIRTVNDANTVFSTKLSIAHGGNATFAGSVTANGTTLTGNTGTVTGNGSANRIAYWANNTMLQSNSGFTFDGTDFVAPNDGAFAGDIKAGKNVFQDIGGKGGYLMRPWGADYLNTTTNVHTGAIKIKLPTGASTEDDMIKFTIDIYQYSADESLSVDVGGYIYRQAGINDSWRNVTAIVNAKSTTENYTVRFGDDGTNHCVWIGELNTSWNHPQIIVRDFYGGFAVETEDYLNEWDVSFEATSFSHVSQTKSNNFPLTTGGIDATFTGTVEGTTFLINRTTAAGVGASLGDINGAELGPGYLSLSRDDTADAKQILFEKNDVEHSYLQTTSSGLTIGGADVTFTDDVRIDGNVKPNFLELFDQNNSTSTADFKIYGWGTELQFTKRNLSTGAHAGTLLALDYTTNAATFLGDVKVKGTNVTVENTINPYIYLNDTNGGAGLFQQEGNDTRIGSDSNTTVKIIQNNQDAVVIDTSKNATFKGDVIIDDGVGRITLESVSGENRIMSTNTGFAAYEKLAFTADAYEFKLGNATFAGSVNINTNGLINFEQNPDIDTGTEVVAQVTKATYTAAFFDFVIKKGTNVRAGVVYACHDGSTGVEYAETSTVDLGDTTDVTLSVDLGSSTMRLLATTTSDDWSVKSLIRAI